MQPAAYAAWAMAQAPATPGSDGFAQPVRIGIADAALRLGVSPDTVRRRVKRGKLEATRDNTGKLWLILPADLGQAPGSLPMQPAAYAPMQQAQSPLIEELRNHIGSLRTELDRAYAERDRLLTMLGLAQDALVCREQGFFSRLRDRLRRRRKRNAESPSAMAEASREGE